MAKKIVNAFMSNRIYLANVKKDGTMSDAREDVTDDVIYATFQRMKTNFERDGKSRIVIKDVGEIKFTPYDEQQK